MVYTGDHWVGKPIPLWFMVYWYTTTIIGLSKNHWFTPSIGSTHRFTTGLPWFTMALQRFWRMGLSLSPDSRPEVATLSRLAWAQAAKGT